MQLEAIYDSAFNLVSMSFSNAKKYAQGFGVNVKLMDGSFLDEIVISLPSMPNYLSCH